MGSSRGGRVGKLGSAASRVEDHAGREAEAYPSLREERQEDAERGGHPASGGEGGGHHAEHEGDDHPEGPHVGDGLRHLHVGVGLRRSGVEQGRVEQGVKIGVGLGFDLRRGVGVGVGDHVEVHAIGLVVGLAVEVVGIHRRVRVRDVHLTVVGEVDGVCLVAASLNLYTAMGAIR